MGLTEFVRFTLVLIWTMKILTFGSFFKTKKMMVLKKIMDLDKQCRYLNRLCRRRSIHDSAKTLVLRFFISLGGQVGGQKKKGALLRRSGILLKY